ncbi:hypothetical protein CDAR_7341 [Caerostris darwini]|uniref:Uncharacterized protein n=1 Tax=Caerostris darwini TaxID=1538125 RepID=A0AAV4UM56_9ARAC|nr:hypothetical protein CDAR_7341 [Caerostris darwini]
MVKRNINCVAQIRHQRAMFCELQKTSAEVDGIFREINFIWLLKIIVRCCMSFYDILTMSWSGVGVSEQSIVILDVIFDIVHFTVLCIVAGKIVDSKTYILETVSAMGKEDILMKKRRLGTRNSIFCVGCRTFKNGNDGSKYFSSE